MTNLELEQLERLLTKYHLETESPLGLSNIRPCLFMVREKLALIGGGYSTAEKEHLVDLRNKMKTFMFYSPSNKEVIAIVANTSQEASILLIKEVENQIIKDDYYLATSCEHKYGTVAATINLESFDCLRDLQNECKLNSLENQSNEC